MLFEIGELPYDTQCQYSLFWFQSNPVSSDLHPHILDIVSLLCCRCSILVVTNSLLPLGNTPLQICVVLVLRPFKTIPTMCH